MKINCSHQEHGYCNSCVEILLHRISAFEAIHNISPYQSETIPYMMSETDVSSFLHIVRAKLQATREHCDVMKQVNESNLPEYRHLLPTTLQSATLEEIKEQINPWISLIGHYEYWEKQFADGMQSLSLNTRKLIQDFPNSVTFQGRVSGDCQCFCWDDVPLEQRSQIVESHSVDVEYGCRLDTMYPNDVLGYLKCEHDQLYIFTVFAQKIQSKCSTTPTNSHLNKE